MPDAWAEQPTVAETMSEAKSETQTMLALALTALLVISCSRFRITLISLLFTSVINVL